MQKLIFGLSLVLLLICEISSKVIPEKEGFQLQIVHFNDFHARFEETNEIAAACKEKCIGGFSRLYTAVRDLKKENSDAIVLNAGDNFQGTLWYSLFKWDVTQHFLNKLPIDAYTLGNHEFDDRIDGLVPFLDALTAPVVAANIDDIHEPTIQGKYKKSTVIERGEKKVGVIGVIISHTNLLSNTEKLIFLDEIESINKEADRLVAEEKVDTIIVLSHCGYELEQEFARKAHPKVGLIVGGHSHTFLYTGSELPSNDKPSGPYPTMVKQSDGRQILVVQAGAYAKYLGNVIVNYDGSGNVVSWNGNPIYLGEKIKQDKAINLEIAKWKKKVDELGQEVLGSSKVRLDQSSCRRSECNLGNLVADAMVHEYIDTDEEGAWTSAAIAVIHAGGLRTSIEKGDVTFNDIVMSQPFEHTFDIGEIQGKYIKEFLEFSVKTDYGQRDRPAMNLLQVSGIRVIFDLSKPEGSRAVSIKIRCRECIIPVYEPLEMEKMYKIVVVSYLAVNGGDGYTVISKNLKNRKIGSRDIDVMRKYIKTHSPIVTPLDGRIQFVD